jgi:hypothetical protein
LLPARYNNGADCLRIETTAYWAHADLNYQGSLTLDANLLAATTSSSSRKSTSGNVTVAVILHLRKGCGTGSRRLRTCRPLLVWNRGRQYVATFTMLEAAEIDGFADD